MNQFTSSQYALMRHGRDNGGQIVPSSQEHCRKNIEKLVDIIGTDKKIRIFHSPLSRARQTAEIARNQFVDLKVQVEVMEMRNFLNYEDGHFDNRDLATLNLNDEGTFTLIVAHQPNIEEYLCYRSSVGNCEIFAKDFVIRQW